MIISPPFLLTCQRADPTIRGQELGWIIYPSSLVITLSSHFETDSAFSLQSIEEDIGKSKLVAYIDQFMDPRPVQIASIRMTRFISLGHTDAKSPHRCLSYSNAGCCVSSTGSKRLPFTH